MSAYRLSHVFDRGDSFAKAATANNLLFCRRRFFQGNAGLAGQFAHRAFQYHAEVLTDARGIAAGKVERGDDTHGVQLFAETPAHAPYILHRLP